MKAMRAVLLAALLALRTSFAADIPPLAGTQPLTIEGDLSAQMVEGIGRWLDRETLAAREDRVRRWRFDGKTSWDFLVEFAEPKRELLRRMLGIDGHEREGSLTALDPVEPNVLQTLGVIPEATGVQPPDGIKIEWVRWPVFDGVWGEGLLLRPPRPRHAIFVAIPDADQSPESIAGIDREPHLDQYARRLAERGCIVLVPVMVNWDDYLSGNERLKRLTNQPHREWIYRPAFEMGRTLIGYEIQKIEAALSALRGLDTNAHFGVFGCGEGGLIALYSAAVGLRFAAVGVSGYFGPRERLFEEPIYRNVFGLLREFGDAELAALCADKRLVIEQWRTKMPPDEIPPPHRRNGGGAAPGKISSPIEEEVEREVARANQIVPRLPELTPLRFIPIDLDDWDRPGRDATLAAFLEGLDAPAEAIPGLKLPKLEDAFRLFGDPQARAVRELQNHTQRLWRLSEQSRATELWSHLKPGGDFEKAQRDLLRELWENVIGKLPQEYLPPNPRTREILNKPSWTGYEVVLDVLPDVFAWGYLLVPKDLKPGERRPVVVCQHGLEGVPGDVVTEDQNNPAWRYYKGFAAHLANRGFIVYAPHNPYRGEDKFRVLQRKANPLGLSLFSFIIAQHDVATRWLATLPFADPERIAFYGLSYGGKTAMRVPALLDRYCLSICSGDFNEWICKNVNIEESLNYPFTGEYEMPEWNLGFTANYAEMAMLIAPRPFMVERGHDDGVGLDHWVGYEWAKVRRGYDKLGIGDRAEIEWFDGPHTINGVGTFKFLHKHLRWPER